MIPLPTDVTTLRGDVLTLRAFEDADVAAVLEASRDPHIPLITTVPAQADADLGRASIGHWVVASARCRGHAAALALISRRGLAPPGLDRLELDVEPWNEGSWRAAERAGYQREGLLRQWQRVGDERRDMLVHSLLRDDVSAAVGER